MRPASRLFLSATSILAAVAPAFAHTGEGGAGGFAHGFVHPFAGIDHLLAMVAVGVVAVQLGGRAVWLLPSTFVAAMAGAGAIGMAGAPLPFVETGIGLSVVTLGAAIAAGSSPPVALAVALIGLFALFHGHAHGAEAPDGSSGLVFAAGFLLATALLHAGGVGLGLLARAPGGRHLVRLGGALMAAAGIGVLAGLV